MPFISGVICGSAQVRSTPGFRTSNRTKRWLALFRKIVCSQPSIKERLYSLCKM